MTMHRAFASPTEIFPRPDTSSRLLARVLEAWQYPILRPVWARALLAAIIISYCVARAVVGLVGSRLYSHDAFWLLDGAWRMMNGQRPQMDFSSMQGFLAFLPSVFGLWISGGTIWGFGYAQALVGVLLASSMFFLAKDRFRDVPLALMCLAVCFTATAPFSLGVSPFQLGPAQTYNRYGYCALALVLVESTAEARKSARRGELLGGFLTGAILAALFFLKITYFVSALFAFLLLLACKKQSKARFAGIFTGGGIVLLVCMAYYFFDLRPVLTDLALLARSRHIRIVLYALDQIVGNAALLLSLSIGAAALVASQSRRGAASKTLIIGTVATLCGMLTIYGNAEFSGFAMAPLIVILIAELLLRYTPDFSSSNNLFAGFLLLTGSAVIATLFIAATLSMGVALFERFGANTSMPHMHGARLSGFATVGDDEPYANFVNNGLDLLNRLRRPSETVMCLDFSNPFAYGLGIRPAPGGTNGLQYKSSFNDKYHPSPLFLFGKADLVMVPKEFTDITLWDSIPVIYFPYLKSHFHQIGESRDWYLYRRDL